jgi:peptidoglycan/LPS O-acetylase OafA/YrhL
MTDLSPRTANPRHLPRSGNFDAIRLFAASAVIFGHSFIILTGDRRLDGFAGVGNSIAVSAVEVFFVISGYLVSQSFQRSGSWLRFVLARCLRIFPGLLACLCFSAFVLGPVFTALPLSEYFVNPTLYRFVARNALLDVYSEYFLPAVSLHPQKGGAIINGSLWSLAFEYSCYAIVLAMGLLRKLEGRTTAVFFVVTLAGATLQILTGLAIFVSYFVAGMSMYFLRQQHRFDGRLACAAAVIILIGSYAWLPQALFPILGGYLIIYAAVDAPFQIKNATRFGDLSYGIYLYGWPMEELAVHLIGGPPPWWQIFLLALAMAAGMAWLSWHLVEQPMLRWKDGRLSGWIPWARVSIVLLFGATTMLFGMSYIALQCMAFAAVALAASTIWKLGERWAGSDVSAGTFPARRLTNVIYQTILSGLDLVQQKLGHKQRHIAEGGYNGELVENFSR